MKIAYIPVKFTIKFHAPVKVDNNPVFVLRGLLGKNLRSMCCVERNNYCTNCMFSQTCVYSYIFETILDKTQNQIMPGADRASHPFAFTANDVVKVGEFITDYSFTITLFGKATKYLPYVYAAFLRAGKDGMFKDRIPFDIINAEYKNESILIEENIIDPDISPEVFDIEQELKKTYDSSKPVLVTLKTPLRFKSQGKYSQDFDSISFFKCLYRRLKTMLEFYGMEQKDLPPYENTQTKIVAPELKWSETSRYSARQKHVMEFGGSVGTFQIEGNISDLEYMLLRFASIANAGKNTNFGLGQISIC